MLTDSHAHLTSTQVVDEMEAILARAKKAGVDKIVNICTDLATLEKGLELAKRHPNVYNTAATTPHDVDTEGTSFFPYVEAAAGELVALGETGLDYHYAHSVKETQQAFLIRYFELALRKQLPLVFHCREAFPDLFALSDVHYRNPAALLHCFTGTMEEATGCLDRGWLISFSGIITFKKSQALRDVVAHVPLERMLIETDTPYLAPQSQRGKPNEPSFIGETAACIASIKGVSLEEVAAATTKNAAQFFKFS